MQLTRHTDYALRLLIHLGHAETTGRAGEGLVQVADVARAQAISLTHLKKVANHLAHLGFVETVRGRGGGMRLARAADRINLAEVVCGTEPGLDLVDCGGCTLLVGGCRLPSVFAEGVGAFRAVLAKYSLADLLARPDPLAGIARSD